MLNTAYLICGESRQLPTKKLVPAGCILVMEAHSGWNNPQPNYHMFDEDLIFKDPINNYKELVKRISKTGKLIIYEAGQEYYDLEYILCYYTNLIDNNLYEVPSETQAKILDSGVQEWPFKNKTPPQITNNQATKINLSKIQDKVHDYDSPFYNFYYKYRNSVYPTFEEVYELKTYYSSFGAVINEVNAHKNNDDVSSSPILRILRVKQSELFTKLPPGVFYNLNSRITDPSIINETYNYGIQDIRNVVPNNYLKRNYVNTTGYSRRAREYLKKYGKPLLAKEATNAISDSILHIKPYYKQSYNREQAELHNNPAKQVDRSNESETAYVILGHGIHMLDNYIVVPPGCIYVVGIAIGETSYSPWLNRFDDDPIFLNPEKNYDALVKKISKNKSLAIYKAGDRCPNSVYILDSIFPFRKEGQQKLIATDAGIQEYPFKGRNLDSVNDSSFLEYIKTNPLNPSAAPIFSITDSYSNLILTYRDSILPTMNDLLAFKDNYKTIKDLLDARRNRESPYRKLIRQTQGDLFKKVVDKELKPGVFYNLICREANGRNNYLESHHNAPPAFGHRYRMKNSTLSSNINRTKYNNPYVNTTRFSRRARNFLKKSQQSNLSTTRHYTTRKTNFFIPEIRNKIGEAAFHRAPYRNNRSRKVEAGNNTNKTLKWYKNETGKWKQLTYNNQGF